MTTVKERNERLQEGRRIELLAAGMRPRDRSGLGSATKLSEHQGEEKRC